MTKLTLLRLADSFSWNDLQSLWPEILQSVAELRFAMHPLGFLHALIAETDELALRLHVWKPGMRWVQEPAWMVHTHTFTLQSLVVSGRLKNYTYEWSAASEKPTSCLYEITYNDNISRLTATGNFGHALTTSITEVGEGQKYVVHRGQFHQTEVNAEELTVTLALTKKGAGKPLVVGAIDGLQSYAYGRLQVHAEVQEKLLSELRRLTIRMI